MWTIIFLIFCLVFAFLFYEAVTTGNVRGRGWGFSVRWYDREDSPVSYWTLTVSYAVIVVWTLLFALKAWIG